MSAFKKAWDILKNEEDDYFPDENFHLLNDPNPTVAFGAMMMNDPKIAEIMRQREEYQTSPYPQGALHTCQHCGKETHIDYDDIWNEKFCSERCAEGKDPTCRQLTGDDCEFVLTSQPEYNRAYSQANNDTPSYDVQLACSKCQNTMWGYVEGD